MTNSWRQSNQRTQHLPVIREIARFFLGGIGNTLVTYILYLLMLTLVDYRVAYTIAFVAGVFLAYWVGLRFVFQQRSSWAKLASFPIVYLAQYAVGLLVVVVWVDLLGAPEALAPIATVLLSLPMTFFLSRRILRGSASRQ